MLPQIDLSYSPSVAVAVDGAIVQVEIAALPAEIFVPPLLVAVVVAVAAAVAVLVVVVGGVVAATVAVVVAVEYAFLSSVYPVPPTCPFLFAVAVVVVLDMIAVVPVVMAVVVAAADPLQSCALVLVLN